MLIGGVIWRPTAAGDIWLGEMGGRKLMLRRHDNGRGWIVTNPEVQAGPPLGAGLTSVAAVAAARKRLWPHGITLEQRRGSSLAL